MTGERLIQDMIQLTESSLATVRKKFLHFTETQNNWKPDTNSWSLNEIFAHLNSYADFYHSTFLSKISKTKYKTPSENFVSSPLGRAAWKSMKLGNAKNIKRKFNAMASYNPVSNTQLLKGKDAELFVDKQIELIAILEQAKEINIRKAKVPISLSKIIKFRMGDAFYFVVFHNERHLQQAITLIQNKSFPKK